MPDWHGAPRVLPPLLADQVHLWLCDLQAYERTSSDLARVLRDDELARADQFRFETNRRRFVAARSVLRQLLAGYTGTDARDLRLVRGIAGKPKLVNVTGSRVDFNLSHSGSLVLLAFSRDREVGVDVEAIRRSVDIEGVARSYFSLREWQALRGAPEAARAAMFFQMWSFKEAHAKATGDGLAADLRWPAWDTGFGWDANPSMSPIAGGLDGWTFVSFTPRPGFAAAVAAQGSGWQLACWQVPADGLQVAQDR